MAKGQQRGNRETKKPKQDKVKVQGHALAFHGRAAEDPSER